MLRLGHFFGKKNKPRNYFLDVGVTATSSPKEIQEAYKRLCFIYHPDRGGDEEIFKVIQEQHHFLQSWLVQTIPIAFDYTQEEKKRYFDRVGANPDLPLPQLPAPSKLSVEEWTRQKERMQTQRRLKRQVQELKDKKRLLLRRVQEMTAFFERDVPVEAVTREDAPGFIHPISLKDLHAKTEELYRYKKLSLEDKVSILALLDKGHAYSLKWDRYWREYDKTKQAESLKEAQADVRTGEYEERQRDIEDPLLVREAYRLSELTMGAPDPYATHRRQRKNRKGERGAKRGEDVDSRREQRREMKRISDKGSSLK